MTGTKQTKSEVVSENIYLKEQIENMQKQLAGLSSLIGNTSKNNEDTINNNERVAVKSNWLGKIGYVLNGRDYIFNNYDDIISLELSTVSDLVANEKYRKQLAFGVINFLDDKWYKYFKVEKGNTIDDQFLIDLLNKKEEQVLIQLNDLTENKTYDCMIHLLQYRFGYLFETKKFVPGMGLLKVLDDYFSNSEYDYKMQEISEYSKLKIFKAVAVKEEPTTK